MVLESIGCFVIGFVLVFLSFIIQTEIQRRDPKSSVNGNIFNLGPLLLMLVSCCVWVPIIKVTKGEFDGYVAQKLQSSGIMLTIVIYISGFLLNFVFSIFSNKIFGQKFEKERTAIYLTSCMLFICFCLNMAFTATASNDPDLFEMSVELLLITIAIILGKFLWFDTNIINAFNETKDSFKMIASNSFASYVFSLCIMFPLFCGCDHVYVSCCLLGACFSLCVYCLIYRKKFHAR